MKEKLSPNGSLSSSGSWASAEPPESAIAATHVAASAFHRECMSALPGGCGWARPLAPALRARYPFGSDPRRSRAAAIHPADSVGALDRAPDDRGRGLPQRGVGSLTQRGWRL